ncbi:hypothetical protein TSUD_318550 [Trifolium subterraneum]|uniref:Uncharacterized protein n=1 Tax=Trifolium subterraneum TaxID=3900 RepID=A0A2Z6MY29_TRISU|nr:hypothetical protein TSUD_318550 [Trifolium subterraneum]
MHIEIDRTGRIPMLRFRDRESYEGNKTKEYDDIAMKLGTKPDQLAAVAYSRIQKELARDGRELGYKSNEVHNKSISKKLSNAGSATKTKKKTALLQFCIDLTARASLGLIDPAIG